AMLDILRGLKPHVPAAQALVWDMAVRGEHIQTILTEIGLVPGVRVPAKKNPEGKEGRRNGTFVPKTTDLEDLSVQMPDGTTRMVHIAAFNGAASVKDLTDTGEPHYEILECVRSNGTRTSTATAGTATTGSLRSTAGRRSRFGSTRTPTMIAGLTAGPRTSGRSPRARRTSHDCTSFGPTRSRFTGGLRTPCTSTEPRRRAGGVRSLISSATPGW